MNIEVIRYRLPVYWVGALINDDWTGLSDEEAQEVDDFVKHADGCPVGVDWGTDRRTGGAGAYRKCTVL